MIKTKKEFMDAIKDMNNPDIEISTLYNWIFISRSFILFDSTDYKKHCNLLSCRLTSKEYDSENIDNYYEREKKLTLKYRKWLNDANKPEPIYNYIIVEQKYMSKIDEWGDYIRPLSAP